MTKRRAPLSFEDALTRIAAEIGWMAMAAACGQAERTVRNWSDPDTPARIPIDSALALDTAYRAAGGDGAPLMQCYVLRLETMVAEATADFDALARMAAVAAKEGGEAMNALILASLPGSSAADREVARREVQQGIDALTNTLFLLSDGVGPSGASGAVPRGDR